MHKIGIIGHSAEYFPEKEPIKQIIENTISLINFQYGENLLINLDGNIGVSHWVADVCLTLGIKYHLFLPSPPEEVYKYWYEGQQQDLSKYFGSSWANTICSPKYNKSNNNVLLVDSSSFVICFWMGKRQGSTFDCIEYCLQTNKLVMNGLNDLKMLTSDDLK
jgi:uncharacterized phage-like protein YoqJ